MADKKIQDFVVLEDAQNDDLILVSSQDTTYTMKVKALKDAVEGMAQRAETAAQDAKDQISNMKETADAVSERALSAALAAENAAESAELSAQSVQKATADANSAAAEALAAKREADTAAENANTAVATVEEAKSAADTAAEQANTAAQGALEAETAAAAAAQAAQEAAAGAQTQGDYAKAQGDRAAELVSEIENTDVGGMAADILALQTGKADLIEGKVPEAQLPELDFDPAGSAAAVQALLSAHTGNKNNPHSVTPGQINAVPLTRKVNGLSLSSDINLTPGDIGLIKQPYVVIGTSTNGHTLDDCDYLCDGVDDQVEIQEALNYAKTKHSRGVLLSGEYNITAPIDVVTPLFSENTLNGQLNSSLGSIITWCGGMNNDSVLISSTSRVCISGLIIKSYSKASWANYGIHLRQCDGAIIENNVIYDVNRAIIGENLTRSTIRGNFVNFISTDSSDVSLNLIYNNYANILAVRGYSVVYGNIVVGKESGYFSLSALNHCIAIGNYLIDSYIYTSINSLLIGNFLYESSNPGSTYIDVGSNCNIIGNCIYYKSVSENSKSIEVNGDNNLVSSNYIYGKNYTNSGGTGNTFVNNKYN